MISGQVGARRWCWREPVERPSRDRRGVHPLPRRLVGIDLGREPVPDETTVCRFRHLLKNGGTLEKAAAMANHASTSATQLYDRRRDELTLDDRADRNSISVSSRSGSSERRAPDPAGI